MHICISSSKLAPLMSCPRGIITRMGLTWGSLGCEVQWMICFSSSASLGIVVQPCAGLLRKKETTDETLDSMSGYIQPSAAEEGYPLLLLLLLCQPQISLLSSPRKSDNQERFPFYSTGVHMFLPNFKGSVRTPVYASLYHCY